MYIHFVLKQQGTEDQDVTQTGVLLVLVLMGCIENKKSIEHHQTCPLRKKGAV